MKLPWYIKPGNKVLVALSRLGFGFGNKGPVVLTVSGRKSGKPRSTPVTPMVVDGKRYVAGLPGADWIANARAAGQATLRRGRRTEQVRMTELPEAEQRPMLRRLPIEVPGWIGFLRSAGLIIDGTPDDFEELADTMPIFRFDPIP
ncbi:nitroreductase family deazaflavin-dependent oxidoreductase [Mycolicibacterium peregrinum]